MPRKSTKPKVPPIGELEPEPEWTQEIDDIDAFFATMGGSATFCRIEKYLKSGELGQCETIGFNEIRDDPAEYLRQHWGAGRFAVALLNDMKRYIKIKTINVEPRPSNGAAPIPAGPDPLMNLQISMMREQMAMYQTMITTLITNNKGPDIAELMKGIGAISRPSDPVAMLASLISAFQAVRPPDVDPMAKARELIGLAKELSPAAPGSSDPAPAGWLDVAKDVGFRILDRIGPGQAPQEPARPAAPAARQAVPVPAAESPQAAAAGGQRSMDDFYTSIREGIAFLRQKAAAKRAPEFWVDYLFEEAQDLRFNAIIHAVQSGATVDNLFDLVPEIASDPFEAQWFKDLYVGIKRSLEGFPASPFGNTLGENLGAAGSGGNGSNAGNHGDGGAVRPADSGGPVPG